MRKTKTMLSLLLALVMILACAPMSFAQEADNGFLRADQLDGSYAFSNQNNTLTAEDVQSSLIQATAAYDAASFELVYVYYCDLVDGSIVPGQLAASYNFDGQQNPAANLPAGYIYYIEFRIKEVGNCTPVSLTPSGNILAGPWNNNAFISGSYTYRVFSFYCTNGTSLKYTYKLSTGVSVINTLFIN